MSEEVKLKNRKIPIAQLILIFWMLVFLACNFYPLVLMVFKSFKTPKQELYDPFSLTFPLNWENYSYAWLYVKDLISNTVLLTAANTLGALFCASIAAYAFSRFSMPGKEYLFLGILSLMMIPGILTLCASYLWVDKLGLVGTRWGVILPTVAGNMPFNIFLLRTFFNGLPKDLFEAAEIDGASKIKQYAMIALPLSMPIVTTAGLWLVMQSWNDIIWPRLILAEEQLTIATGLIPFTNDYFKLTGAYSAPMAGYVITSLPLIVIYLFTSKQYIAGMTSGALKM